jgi:hypothetical protein
VFVILSALFKGRVVGSIHKSGSTRLLSLCLAVFFSRFCSPFLPSPSFWICGRTFEFLCYGYHWGLIGGGVHSLDHCICPIGAVIGCDPSWSPFDFIWENPTLLGILHLHMDFWVDHDHTSRIIFFSIRKLLVKFEIFSKDLLAPGAACLRCTVAA